VRVSAYCHLIETQENGAQAPYGVVLFADNYNVQIVPNHEYAKDTFGKGCACVTNWRRRLSKTQMTSQNGRAAGSARDASKASQKPRPLRITTMAEAANRCRFADARLGR